MRNFASKLLALSVSIINCIFFTLIQEIKLGGRGIRSTPYEPYSFYEDLFTKKVGPAPAVAVE